MAVTQEIPCPKVYRRSAGYTSSRSALGPQYGLVPFSVSIQDYGDWSRGSDCGANHEKTAIQEQPVGWRLAGSYERAFEEHSSGFEIKSGARINGNGHHTVRTLTVEQFPTILGPQWLKSAIGRHAHGRTLPRIRLHPDFNVAGHVLTYTLSIARLVILQRRPSPPGPVSPRRARWLGSSREQTLRCLFRIVRRRL